MTNSTAKSTLLIPGFVVFRGDFHEAVPVAPDKPLEKVFKVWGGFPKDTADKVAKDILAMTGKESFAGLRNPLKSGEAVKEDGTRRYGEYASGLTILNAKSKFAPKLMLGKDKAALPKDVVYPGLIGALLVRPYFYNKAGNTGISLTLLGFWATAKGPKLEIGGVDVDGEFEQSASALSFGDLADLEEPLF
jgi:hypothetical protein